MNHELISRRVKEIRTEILKMSQREFSEALGVSKPLISMWENINNEKGPSKEMAIKIARLANISVAYVLGESNEKNSITSVQDEFEELITQFREKDPEKQKEIMKLFKDLMKITGD
ncbi:helix-turn-helix transcriptional regulator [Bacillus cereus group sp. Bc002]|uniref:helix-turn-helix domain-containing protein n=1 Tax=Bacillus cereus group TaxID=86661 RepID=UPI0013D5B988|nr:MULTISPECIES: helix-turn-helix transcriptional regulator [Bacillus cereus group]MDA1958558.1 helix-turn-helix transcriptional regulator [Bacillus cereus group sp. BcHK10]MDA2782303.1 helix-turn-helix transcriptional regulator [Bacillus cereus group sp. Bc002]HDR7766287.1 helix-turn-helix transcriptional regulator [Bacillus paranthracis]